MNMKRSQSLRLTTVLMAAVCMLPIAGVARLAAQMDPNQGVQTPQNQNLPGNQPGMSNSTGSSAAGQQTTMRDTLGAPGETGQEMADTQFIRKSAASGIALVKLGELAVQKGGPEVKEFAQKMIDDHTTIDKDMASVADAMGVMLPKKMDKDDQAELTKLSALSGDAFDKEYITAMIKDHREEARSFRMEAMSASDTDLQAEVVKAGTLIRQHLTMLTKLAAEKGVPMPPRPQRSPAPAGQ